MGKGSGRQRKSTMRIMEEAIHQLRLAPLDLLATYYIGTLPFVLGFLFFWSDMSRRVGAEEHAAAASLALALLFGWMKIWQAAFSSRVMSRLDRKPKAARTLSGFLFFIASQTLIQATGLVVMPLALLMTLPAGWCFAFYQNVTVLAERTPPDLKSLIVAARSQAALWPGQNHKLLALFSLFGPVVFVNLAVAVFALPHLIKTLFGHGSVFTLSGIHLLNTTFWMSVLGLTYLCVDPLVKTAYALRCFYGMAVISGADLRIDLKRLASLKSAAPVLAALAIAVQTGTGICSDAAGPLAGTSVSTQRRISPEDLDRSIDTVLQRREFSWRLPPEKPASNPRSLSWLRSMFRSMWAMMAKGMETVGEWLEKPFEWLRKLFENEAPVREASSGQPGWKSAVRAGLYLLCGLIPAAGLFMLWKTWRSRLAENSAARPETPPMQTPDMEDENIVADDLPSEKWIEIARDLLARGERRQAVRAVYLSTLAFLSEQGWIAVEKYKTNRDYVAELRQRTSDGTALLEDFSGQVDRFDRLWYGMYPVTGTDVNTAVQTRERILVRVQTV